MPTPNQLSTLNFQNNLVLNGLDMPDRIQMVWDISGGWNVLTFLTDRLSRSRSRQIVGLDGKFEKPIIGRNNVIQTIASNLQIGGNLQVNFTDVTYDLFRNNRVVIGSNGEQGRVVSHGAGFVVLEPNGTPAALVAATHFLAGTFIKDGWNASQNMGSTGEEPLYEYPHWVFNYTSISRGTADWFRRNMNQTWVRTGKGEMSKYWYSSIEDFAVKQFAKSEEIKAWEGERAQIGSGASAVNYSGGLLWAIKDPIRGGVVKPMSNNPTKADLEDFVMEVAARQAVPNVRLIGLAGQGMMANIQTNMTQDFIIHSGQYNTFGGAKVDGIDVRSYTIAGVTLDIIPCPYFNDRERFPELSTIAGVIGTKRGNDLVILDEGMFPTIGGGEAPALERCYFGDKDICYGYLNGIGMQGAGNPIDFAGRSFGQIVSNRDSIQFEIYSDSCPVDAIAQRMGYMFLTN